MSQQPSRKRGDFPGRPKTLYIKGANAVVWAEFEALAEKMGISQSDAIVEAIEHWTVQKEAEAGV